MIMFNSKRFISFEAMLAVALILSGSLRGSRAQFMSGSDGTDGALHITANTALPVQADGVHNYTTITVDSGVTLSFQRNATNTPVILLASGDVNIMGTISLDGQNGRNTDDPLAGMRGSEAQPGPGGYPGGIGGVAMINGGTGIATSGGGPGGGQASTDPTASSNGGGRGGNGGSHATPGAAGFENASSPAPTYGDPHLLTLTGGSGGGGGNMFDATVGTTNDGAGGGAGGGAILIASSGTITINGTVGARGGNGGVSYVSGGVGTNGGGGGGGGAIRLMANSVGGSGSLFAQGGAGGVGGAGAGGTGYIRLETFSSFGSLPNNSNPGPSNGSPSVVRLDPAVLPTIKVTSIGGVAVPPNPTGSTATPDVIIPPTTTNPVTIAIQTTNVPNGSIVHLRMVLEDGSILLVDSAAVAGNAASAQATIPMGIGVIYATADFP